MKLSSSKKTVIPKKSSRVGFKRPFSIFFSALGAGWNPGGGGGAMIGCGFDREFAAEHLQPFPHAQQSQSAVCFRAEDAFHIKGFAVVFYRKANPGREFFNLNFHRAGPRMNGHVIEGFQSS